jgi:hypothetical protein
LNRATRLTSRSREPDRLGVADAVDLVLAGVDLARVRLWADFVAFDLDRARADEDLVAFVVRVVVVRLRACAGLAGFLPGVDLADFLAGANLVVPVSEGLVGVAGGVESDGAVAEAERVGADAGVALAGVGFGVVATPVGVEVAVDGVLPAPFPVEAGVGAGSVGALSAPAFVGAESVGEVRLGVVAMRVLAIAGGQWGKRRNVGVSWISRVPS